MDKLLVPVGDNILASDYSIEKDLEKIKKAIKIIKTRIKHKTKVCKKASFNPDNYRTAHIVFGFNPSRFKTKKGFNNYINDAEVIINAYRTGLLPFEEQMIQGFNVAQSNKRMNQTNHVHSYTETAESRAMGLYIWDQVNYFGIPKNNAINSLIDSELGKSFFGKIGRGERDAKEHKQDLYREIDRRYEYACICVEYGELLTGAECERIIANKKKEKEKLGEILSKLTKLGILVEKQNAKP